MRLLATALAALLASAPAPDVCEALNVTVSPGPTVRYSEGDNATLYCHISQKRKTDNLLAVRWVFAVSPTQEYLMIKMTKFGSVQYYGNYTHHFHKQRLHLLKEKHGSMYKFLILSLQQTDQGHYICKVQEIGKHRNKWTAWSNGTAATEIREGFSCITARPKIEQKEQYKLPKALGYFNCTACAVSTKVTVFKDITVTVFSTILFHLMWLYYALIQCHLFAKAPVNFIQACTSSGRRNNIYIAHLVHRGRRGHCIRQKTAGGTQKEESFCIFKSRKSPGQFITEPLSVTKRSTIPSKIT